MGVELLHKRYHVFMRPGLEPARAAPVDGAATRRVEADALDAGCPCRVAGGQVGDELLARLGAERCDARVKLSVIRLAKRPKNPKDFFKFDGSDFPVSMGKRFCYSQMAQFVRSGFASVVGKTDGSSLGSLSLRHSLD
jgi:hypothetical protein